MDLGAPIGSRQSAPDDAYDQHGAGVGLSGGADAPNAQNSQSGQFAENERSGFNAGLGGQHASGGLPGSGTTPIADKFMGSSNPEYGTAGYEPNTGSGLGGAGGDKLDNALDNYDGKYEGQSGGFSQGQGGQGQGEAVSGAYESGGFAGDALTGQSHAQRTGAGVGPLGENLGGGQDQSYSTGGGAGLGAAGLGAGAAGAGAYEYSQDSKSTKPLIGNDLDATAGYQGGSGQTGQEYGTGVGQSGSDQYGNSGQYQSGQYDQGQSGQAGDGAGVGSGGNTGSGGAGHYGKADEGDFDRGAPISKPDDLDTGGPHSLVYQESTGKYVHRRDL